MHPREEQLIVQGYARIRVVELENDSREGTYHTVQEVKGSCNRIRISCRILDTRIIGIRNILRVYSDVHLFRFQQVDRGILST